MLFRFKNTIIDLFKKILTKSEYLVKIMIFLISKKEI